MPRHDRGREIGLLHRRRRRRGAAEGDTVGAVGGYFGGGAGAIGGGASSGGGGGSDFPDPSTFSTSGSRNQLGEILKPEQWQRLIQRLDEIPNPKVPAKPSAASLPAKGKQPSGD